MTETARDNDQIPTDPRTLLILALACLTVAAVLPPERVQSFAALFTLVLQVTGRR
ncbi:hypothetical protein AB0F30_16820 [Streptomyces sp. NPDC029006]|uniref:hypothetical protein n=1 Tax=Streptomyces sp. NPDC029006 TaxID=3155467 RepID=UPI0033DFF9B1